MPGRCKDGAFVDAAVVNVVKAVLEIDFSTIFGRHAHIVSRGFVGWLGFCGNGR